MKIDVKDNSGSSEYNRCEFPLDYKYIGTEEHHDDLMIFIEQNTLDEVDMYLSSDLNNELGGVLVGDICVTKEKKKFILIDDIIIAKHTNSSLSRLTFTHETWDYINDVLEKKFPNKKILGWFHSHPGHTVFLSTFDMFIQENFFNMDHMVAYVFDPTIKERGFFLWRDKKTVKADGYYIFGVIEKENFNEVVTIHSNEDMLEINEAGKSDYKNKNGNFRSIITIGLLLLTLLLLLVMIYNIYDFKQKTLLKEEYEKDLTEIREENKKLTDRLNDLVMETELKRKSLIKENSVEAENSSISNPVNTSNVNENNTKSSGNTNTKELPKSDSKDNAVSVTKYKVKSGDTLEKISNQFYKSRAGIDLIMKHNNIKNKADIKIGQELELPEMNQ